MSRQLLEIENARIMFRNFEGRETEYNRLGDRNFCVVIEDEETAMKLEADGWNVKRLQPRNDDESVTYYISVAVKFTNFPPTIWMVTSSGKAKLEENDVHLLDGVDIDTVDLIINPRYWDDNGRERIKAYLKTMYVVIDEDRFARKYADMESPEE